LRSVCRNSDKPALLDQFGTTVKSGRLEILDIDDTAYHHTIAICKIGYMALISPMTTCPIKNQPWCKFCANAICCLFWLREW
jgi:hypothetical protein